MTIDIDSLREDLKDYYGTAMQYNPTAMMDLIKVENASDREVVNMAINNGINIYDYEIKHRGR